METIKIEKKQCLCCMETHPVPTVRILEKNRYKGVDVEYLATYEYCKLSDEYIANEQMISDNYIAMKEAYREKMRLPT